MRLLMRGHSDLERGEYCDYAVVTIDETLAKTIASRRKIFEEARQRDPDCFMVGFRDLNVDWFVTETLININTEHIGDIFEVEELLDDDQKKLFDNENYAILPDTFKAPREDADDVESDTGQMIISEHGFEFTCHVDTYAGVMRCYTSAIPFSVLSKLI